MRIYNRALRADKPVAKSLNYVKDSSPAKAIDGNINDGSKWVGAGVPIPNWLEITLPEEKKLARVIIYPGDRRFAAYPSTECSPKKDYSSGMAGWEMA